MTHNERVLHLLRDGKPHTHHELYALHVIAHSRISDLRRDGHVIESWRDGDSYLYRLVPDGGTTGVDSKALNRARFTPPNINGATSKAGRAPVPVVSDSGALPLIAGTGVDPVDTNQLSLLGAA